MEIWLNLLTQDSSPQWNLSIVCCAGMLSDSCGRLAAQLYLRSVVTDGADDTGGVVMA